MEIILRRIKDDGDATSGELSIDGCFECYTLEDQHNEKKKYGETRIPSGRYRIGFRKDGTLYTAYKERFKTWFIGSLEIKDIPGFTRVYFHAGNADDETLGCPLLGTKIEWYKKNGKDCQRIKRGTSTQAYVNFGKQVTAALLTGEQVNLTIKDEVG